MRQLGVERRLALREVATTETATGKYIRIFAKPGLPLDDCQRLRGQGQRTGVAFLAFGGRDGPDAVGNVRPFHGRDTSRGAARSTAAAGPAPKVAIGFGSFPDRPQFAVVEDTLTALRSWWRRMPRTNGET